MSADENSYPLLGRRLLLNEKMSLGIRGCLHLPCSKVIRRWQEPIRHLSRPDIRKRNLGESFFHLIQPSARSHEFKFPVSVYTANEAEISPIRCDAVSRHDCG